MKNNIFILGFLIITSCSKPPQSIGDTSINVFSDTHLYFDMALKQDSSVFNQDIIRLDAGRVLLKKVKIPKYEIQPKVTVNMTLTSNGDPWDKSGSLFVIPNTASLNILDFEEGTFSLKDLNEKLKMSISLLSYHINGNLKYKGLREFRLVETKEKNNNLFVKLSEMGNLLLKGYVKDGKKN